MTDYDDAYYRQLLTDAYQEIYREGDQALGADGVPVGLRRASDRFYTEDCRFTVPGRGPYAFSGGKKEWHAMVARQMTELTGTWSCEVEATFASGDWGVALVIYTAERDGQPFRWRRANVYRFRDGKVCEVRTYEHDQYEFDEFTRP